MSGIGETVHMYAYSREQLWLCRHVAFYNFVSKLLSQFLILELHVLFEAASVMH